MIISSFFKRCLYNVLIELKGTQKKTISRQWLLRILEKELHIAPEAFTRKNLSTTRSYVDAVIRLLKNENILCALQIRGQYRLLETAPARIDTLLKDLAKEG